MPRIANWWLARAGLLLIAGLALASTQSTLAAISGVVVGSSSYTGPCDLTTCAEAYSLTRAMTRSYAGPLFDLTRVNSGTLGKVKIVFKGDSITFGTNASSGQGTTSGPVYPGVTMAALSGTLPGDTFTSLNKGIAGERCDTMITNAATEMQPLIDSTAWKNVAVVLCGANDIGCFNDGTHSGCSTAADVYARLNTYSSLLRSYGYTVVVMTILPSGSAVGFDAIRDAVNVDLRADHSFANALSDPGGDGTIGCDGCENNATYYNASDKTHPTDAGYAILGSYPAATLTPLLQTTLTVGLGTNHLADLSGVPAFCAGMTCLNKKIYAQISGNDILASNGVGQTGGSLAAVCVTATACAGLYLIDPTNGYPVIRAAWPVQYYSGNSAATGITGGTHASSVYWYGRNEGWTNIAGQFGIAHPVNQCCASGTDFIATNLYGSFAGNCTDANKFCQGIDEEGPGALNDFLTYSPATLQTISHMITWDGAAATNTVKTYINSATAAFSHSPPDLAPLNIGNGVVTVHFAAGGDGTHGDLVLQEGLITNSALTSSDYVAINANVAAFYGSHSPDACASTADFGYYFGGTNGGDAGPGANTAVMSTALAYGLRRMSASYWGPIADLTDALGTTHTYGPATTGCGIDPAAATFCAANPPCHAQVYNQGYYNSTGFNNANDGLLKMVNGTAANRPTVNFSGLNGLPTLVFSGSQSLCTGTPNAANDIFLENVAMVAKRTSGAASAGLMFHGSSNWLGWAAGANTAQSAFPSATISGAASDGAFHSIIYELLAIGAGGATLYVDGSSVATGSNSFSDVGTNKICLGVDGAGGSFLTGEIAEATVSANGAPGNGTNGTATQTATIYAKQHAEWGI